MQCLPVQICAASGVIDFEPAIHEHRGLRLGRFLLRVLASSGIPGPSSETCTMTLEWMLPYPCPAVCRRRRPSAWRRFFRLRPHSRKGYGGAPRPFFVFLGYRPEQFVRIPAHLGHIPHPFLGNPPDLFCKAKRVKAVFTYRLQHSDCIKGYSSASRYPTPISVRIYRGFAGLFSILRRRPAIKARSAWVSLPYPGPQISRRITAVVKTFP